MKENARGAAPGPPGCRAGRAGRLMGRSQGFFPGCTEEGPCRNDQSCVPSALRQLGPQSSHLYNGMNVLRPRLSQRRGPSGSLRHKRALQSGRPRVSGPRWTAQGLGETGAGGTELNKHKTRGSRGQQIFLEPSVVKTWLVANTATQQA